SNPVARDLQLQAATTSLRGTITDTQNLPIAIASVIVTDSQGNQVLSTSTDFNGRYKFDQLPAGTYIVRAIAEGYLPTVVNSVILQDGQVTSGVDATLMPVGVDDFVHFVKDFKSALDKGVGLLVQHLSDFMKPIDPGQFPKPEDLPDLGPLLIQVHADQLNGT